MISFGTKLSVKQITKQINTSRQTNQLIIIVKALHSRLDRLSYCIVVRHVSFPVDDRPRTKCSDGHSAKAKGFINETI